MKSFKFARQFVLIASLLAPATAFCAELGSTVKIGEANLPCLAGRSTDAQAKGNVSLANLDAADYGFGGGSVTGLKKK